MSEHSLEEIESSPTSLQDDRAVCRTAQRIRCFRSLITLLVLILGLTAAGLSWHFCTPAAFEHPDFEAQAVKGVPTVDAEKFGYTPLDVAEGYRVLLCALPANDGKTVELNFTNLADNTVWLRAEVRTKQGELLGSTGVLKQGEYLPALTLDAPLTQRETPVSVRIIAYEPNKWTSRSNVNLDLTLYKDYR